MTRLLYGEVSVAGVDGYAREAHELVVLSLREVPIQQDERIAPSRDLDMGAVVEYPVN